MGFLICRSFLRYSANGKYQLHAEERCIELDAAIRLAEKAFLTTLKPIPSSTMSSSVTERHGHVVMGPPPPRLARESISPVTFVIHEVIDILAL